MPSPLSAGRRSARSVRTACRDASRYFDSRGATIASARCSAAFASARTSPSVAPGFSPAVTPRLVNGDRAGRGTVTSGDTPRSRPKNPGGVTPTTAAGWPFT